MGLIGLFVLGAAVFGLLRWVLGGPLLVALLQVGIVIVSVCFFYIASNVLDAMGVPAWEIWLLNIGTATVYLVMLFIALRAYIDLMRGESQMMERGRELQRQKDQQQKP